MSKIDAGDKGAVVSFHNDRVENLEGLLAFVQSQAGRVKLRPDQKLVYRRNWGDAKSRIRGVKALLDDLAKAAA